MCSYIEGKREQVEGPREREILSGAAHLGRWRMDSRSDADLSVNRETASCGVLA